MVARRVQESVQIIVVHTEAVNDVITPIVRNSLKEQLIIAKYMVEDDGVMWINARKAQRIQVIIVKNMVEDIVVLTVLIGLIHGVVFPIMMDSVRPVSSVSFLLTRVLPLIINTRKNSVFAMRLMRDLKDLSMIFPSIQVIVTAVIGAELTIVNSLEIPFLQ
jgi:hypothetical protein